MVDASPGHRFRAGPPSPSAGGGRSRQRTTVTAAPIGQAMNHTGVIYPHLWISVWIVFGVIMGPAACPGRPRCSSRLRCALESSMTLPNDTCVIRSTVWIAGVDSSTTGSPRARLQWSTFSLFTWNRTMDGWVAGSPAGSGHRDDGPASGRAPPCHRSRYHRGVSEAGGRVRHADVGEDLATRLESGSVGSTCW